MSSCTDWVSASCSWMANWSTAGSLGKSKSSPLSWWTAIGWSLSSAARMMAASSLASVWVQRSSYSSATTQIRWA